MRPLPFIMSTTTIPSRRCFLSILVFLTIPSRPCFTSSSMSPLLWLAISMCQHYLVKTLKTDSLRVKACFSGFLSSNSQKTKSLVCLIGFFPLTQNKTCLQLNPQRSSLALWWHLHLLPGNTICVPRKTDPVLLVWPSSPQMALLSYTSPILGHLCFCCARLPFL